MADTLRAGLVISSVTYKDTSKNGNPRFTVVFTDGTSALTEIDASVGYGIQNSDVHGVLVDVTFNSAGRIVHVMTKDGMYEA